MGAIDTLAAAFYNSTNAGCSCACRTSWQDSFRPLHSTWPVRCALSQARRH